MAIASDCWFFITWPSHCFQTRAITMCIMRLPWFHSLVASDCWFLYYLAQPFFPNSSNNHVYHEVALVSKFECVLQHVMIHFVTHGNGSYSHLLTYVWFSLRSPTTIGCPWVLSFVHEMQCLRP